LKDYGYIIKLFHGVQKEVWGAEGIRQMIIGSEAFSYLKVRLASGKDDYFEEVAGAA
jgi:hypothetical protein